MKGRAAPPAAAGLRHGPQHQEQPRRCPFPAVVGTGSAYQGRHVPSVHLAAGDLQLGLGHGPHLEVLGAPSPGAHDGRQGHRAQLRLADAVKLLLQHSRPATGGGGKRQLDPGTLTSDKPPPRTSATAVYEPPRVKDAHGMPGAAAVPRACSTAHLLLRRHGVFQHGGLLIPLQSEMVFALFLWR